MDEPEPVNLAVALARLHPKDKAPITCSDKDGAGGLHGLPDGRYPLLARPRPTRPLPVTQSL